MQIGPAMLQPTMNWDDLRVFLALARSGTLAGAARSVGQDATTVSRRIARLELALGLTLFEHGTAGQTLTEGGHRLLAQAEAMEAGARAVQQQAEAGAGLGGTIRVSVSEGFGTGFVAPRLAGFAERHPGIAVDLIASTGFLNPSRREADVAIMLARPKGGPLIAAKLTDYRLGVYAADAYLAAHGSACCCTARAPASIASACANSRWPPSVSVWPAVPCSNSVRPSASSSRAIRRDTVVASCPTLRAAPASVPDRASARKTRRSSQFIVGCNIAGPICI
jgi:DNA-binding transcriptional LysR family regulator